ncbi:MAG TPA: MAPEG family protein [Usitatibacteraceae bacterium]|nr:MAPEG family protein [Usitatibacteraceae bacterium]
MIAALPHTAVYASLCTLLIVVLLLLVVRLRRKLKVGIGDGGHRDLARAIRVHANAIESVPLFLILLAIYEHNGGGAVLLNAFGSVFLIARIAHAAGMLRTAGASLGRVAGTAGSIACLVGLAVANLARVIGLF